MYIYTHIYIHVSYIFTMYVEHYKYEKEKSIECSKKYITSRGNV